MYGSDVWGIRIGKKYKYCNLSGYYIISMGILKQKLTKEEWEYKANIQFVLDYAEIQQILKEEPSKFNEVNNLEELRKLSGDCTFLVTPDVTLINRKCGDHYRFISVKRDLKQYKTADEQSE